MAEQFPSRPVDWGPRTSFVIEDNSQSLQLWEMVIIKTQDLKGIKGKIHKCICDFFVSLPSLPNGLLALPTEGRGYVATWKYVKSR